MKMFCKNKISLFHRIKSDRLILIFPDGRICRVSNFSGLFTDPCYSKMKAPFVLGEGYFGKYKTPQGALKAMRKYEKLSALENAELIGEI